MSYILEALKKSDKERKQSQTQDIEAVFAPNSDEINRGSGVFSNKLTGLLLLLLIMLTVSTVWIGFSVLPKYFSSPHSTHNVENISQPSEPVISQALENSIQKEKIHTEDRRTHAPASKTEFPKEAPQPAEKPFVTPKTAEKEQIVTKTVPEKPRVPLLAELPQSLQDKVLPLEFAGHVFSEVPTQRLIMINRKIIREGNMVRTNLRLEEITPNGVILKYQVTRFRMDLF